MPDIRHPGCKTKLYHAALPTVSVVIPFYNEHWSTLLRTFHSVINRSPSKLLKEVILVDDASNKPELKMQLDDYVSKLPKVSVVRMDTRGGLRILARGGVGGTKLQAQGGAVAPLPPPPTCGRPWLETKRKLQS